MKNLRINLFYLLFISNLLVVINAKAQEKLALYVHTNIEDAKPDSNFYRTKDSVINSIFNNFRVHQYIPKYIGATSDILKNIFTIFAYGSLDSLKIALVNSGKFTNMKFMYDIPVLSCQNPLSNNDTVTVDSIVGNWGMELVDAQCAWAITKGDSNIIVGMVDTEVDTSHEDLKGKIVYVNDSYPCLLYTSPSPRD